MVEGIRRGSIVLLSQPSIDWRLFLADMLCEAHELYPFIDEKENDLVWRDWVKRLKVFL